MSGRPSLPPSRKGERLFSARVRCEADTPSAAPLISSNPPILPPVFVLCGSSFHSFQACRGRWSRAETRGLSLVGFGIKLSDCLPVPLKTEGGKEWRWHHQNTSVVLKKRLCEMDPCFPCQWCFECVCFVLLEFAFALSLE